ncbi:MAG: class I SAM-dependent methyltransferase, partial [Gammaproteobacteria bacterium]|nr:class I SAM-dependent methyltransferase [Gammaproteobacteria bacterium]
MDKWAHYFPIYDRHFSWYANKSVTFLEIGVARGGSLQMWQRFFGPLAKVVGIDIQERSKSYETSGTFVRIGDQSDERFLQSIVDEFGVPDVVLDDGSHHMEHISKTFNFLYPKLPKNGVYMVEDLHTAYWDEYGGGLSKADTFINKSKSFIDQLNAD